MDDDFGPSEDVSESAIRITSISKNSLQKKCKIAQYFIDNAIMDLFSGQLVSHCTS